MVLESQTKATSVSFLNYSSWKATRLAIKIWKSSETLWGALAASFMSIAWTRRMEFSLW